MDISSLTTVQEITSTIMNKFLVLFCVLGVGVCQYSSGGYHQSTNGGSHGGYANGNSRNGANGGYTSGNGANPSRNGYGSTAGNGYEARSQFAQKDDDLSEPAKYEFKYDVFAPEYNVEFGHEEQRDGDNTVGSYYVLLHDGRRQLVEYTADEEGFKPKISYTEAENTDSTGAAGQAGYQAGQSSYYSPQGEQAGANVYRPKDVPHSNQQHGAYKNGGSGSY